MFQQQFINNECYSLAQKKWCPILEYSYSYMYDKHWLWHITIQTVSWRKHLFAFDFYSGFAVKWVEWWVQTFRTLGAEWSGNWSSFYKLFTNLLPIKGNYYLKIVQLWEDEFILWCRKWLSILWVRSLTLDCQAIWKMIYRAVLKPDTQNCS